MVKFFQAHWGTVISVLGVVGSFVDWNQVATFASAHHTTALGVVLAAFLKVKQEKGFLQ